MFGCVEVLDCGGVLELDEDELELPLVDFGIDGSDLEGEPSWASANCSSKLDTSESSICWPGGRKDLIFSRKSSSIFSISVASNKECCIF